MKKLVVVFFILLNGFVYGQGFNHQWLLGYWPVPYLNGRILFDSTSYVYNTEQREMGFWGTQGNISNKNGNFLMSSNGVWIANAHNDTMMNGAGLNPGSFVNSWIDGLIIPYGNVFLPYPGDSTKYVLVHQTGTQSSILPSTELFYTIIDMTLDSGLGGVISKNNIIFQDSIGWGIGACRHANGRDWWIVAIKDSTDIIYKVLFTPLGVASITTQHLNVPVAWSNASQLTFSSDGNKFIYSTYPPGNVNVNYLLLFDFDRCAGMFSNPHVINTTDGASQWGLAFSPNSTYVYKTSTQHVFQINVNTLTVDTIATYDGFYSPNSSCCATDFFFMYLAANGKIYITSGSGVQHIHEINYPDSADTACNVVQHAINLGIYNLRAVPNHPNYYLGRIPGSPCDTLQWAGIAEQEHDFKFSIYPNPITGNNLHIGYLLPQNKPGKLLIYDITGKVIFKYNLPQWSTEQKFTLPELSDGIYNCVIASEGYRVSKKLAMIKQ